MCDDIKTINDWDCRAISDRFLKKFISFNKQKGLSYAPFVELVTKHPELQLAFRGNEYEKNNPTTGGKVIVYRNNHAMFTISSRNVGFNPNYFRYDPEWEIHLDTLISKYKYNNGVPIVLGKPIKTVNPRTGVEAWSCHCEKDYISRKIDAQFMDELDDIYLLLSEVFDRFFDEKYKDDQFLLWANKNDPVNKGLVFQKKKKVELEKIRQQQLFSLMKAQTDGYYFYDMEFEQKHKSSEDKELDKEKGLNNKPDMQAIRYDTDGNPSAWVFVEVKCTKMAYGGKSGLKEHVNKMRKYILDEENLKRRRREAYLIMSQYEKLKLEMFKKPLNDNDFANLPAEILLIFTDDAISEWTSERDESFVKLRNEQKIIKLDNNVDAIMVKV